MKLSEPIDPSCSRRTAVSAAQLRRSEKILTSASKELWLCQSLLAVGVGCSDCMRCSRRCSFDSLMSAIL